MKRVLITGGAGFIGTNLAKQLIQDNCEVVILDNLSRKGVQKNLDFLRPLLKNKSAVIEGDVRNYETVEKAVQGVDTVFHLAAQVAVTTSVSDPLSDCQINLMGTMNVLEACRLSAQAPTILFTSTNKVYGGMEDVKISQTADRYAYADLPQGVSEARGLDFYSPYGCSKGAADQYVHDYSRIYGLRTIVFRMSCIYGPHQYGNEDQGWVAHFMICALKNEPINIYGDGKQVRDALFVGDLVQAFKTAVKCKDKFKNQVYNVGGGPSNTLSLLELIKMLEKSSGKKIPVKFSSWRPGDQRVYISDIRKIKDVIGWAPQTGVSQGLSKLLDWLKINFNH